MLNGIQHAQEVVYYVIYVVTFYEKLVATPWTDSNMQNLAILFARAIGNKDSRPT